MRPQQLDAISVKAWETTGTIIGLLACMFIAIQLYHELLSNVKSSLSWFHLIGFVFVYLFWFLYGLRFNHIGVWLPNAVAAVLQLSLSVAVIFKSLAH